jgi:hypothetical protein
MTQPTMLYIVWSLKGQNVCGEVICGRHVNIGGCHCATEFMARRSAERVMEAERSNREGKGAWDLGK